MPLFCRAAGKQPAGPPGRRARPRLEELEERWVPYAASGNAWPHPELITLSFVPDGTLMASGSGGSVYSNMFSKFNGRWAAAQWQAEVVKAAQVWAQYANINFDVVSDNGTTSGQGSYQQGDPGMGDLRISGYGFSSNYLALGYLPPPGNNYSVGGDIALNTNVAYNIGSTYDLQTVALHEIGHALGLLHSTLRTADMYPIYAGAFSELTTDDISGIRAIYGARQPDAREGLLGNDTFLTAYSLTSQINATTKAAQVGNLDITTTSDVDCFSFVAPAGSSGTMTVSVQSAGLSLLRPDLSVYDALGNMLAWNYASDTYDGSTVTLTVSGVSAGQTYYVQVMGADTTAFGTGKYALTVNLGTGAMPAVSLPNTLTANGAVLSGSGGLANFTGNLDTMAANAKVERLTGRLEQLWNNLSSHGSQQGATQPLPAPVLSALLNGDVSLSHLTRLLVQQLGGVSNLTLQDAAMITWFVWDAKKDGFSWY